MQENITVKEWREKYRKLCEKTRSSVSDYAGFAYDAVWMYALVLDKLIKGDPQATADLHSPNTTMYV